MNNFSKDIGRGIKKGDRIFGYQVKNAIELINIRSFLYELEHLKTGARHLHIQNQDMENTFSVAFKTVPKDSTGVAHILEHTVLCGSKKFPVKDPFFSMLKRSLNTFMNAFTSSDWTMYPFSTQNKKDFYNLMEVYLDAVFFPNINKLSFKQEGHRLEFQKTGQGSEIPILIYKGVVYNEMKGAMSSPEQIMVRSIMNALYPDTTYSHNSGGDPPAIPTLTHNQLIHFHKVHYHPSNSFFYTYGNLPLEEHLYFLENKVLKFFQHISPDTNVPPQPRWQTSKDVTYTYPFDEKENPLKKYQVCVAWLMADIKDTFEVLVLGIIEQILLGNAASPVRKALMDSNLGSTLSDGTGFDSDNRDTMFVCGLKDVEKASANKIEKIIFDVLNDVSENGIEKEMIESAIHQIEFHRKEKTNTPYPYGIKLLIAISGSWFHGGKPQQILSFDEELKKLREKLSQENFLENRIRRYFIDNQHKILLTLAPDQNMAKRESDRVKTELEKIRLQLNPSDIEKIKIDTMSLEKLQGSEEDISCLPTLEIDDIPPFIHEIKKSNGYNTIPFHIYTQPTSGIFYFSSAFGMGNIDKKLVPLVPFLCYSIPKIGTKLKDYSQMAQAIARFTGGLTLSAQARTAFNKNGVLIPFVTFNSKCLSRNIDRMFELVEELFFQFEFSDLNRLKILLFEYQSGLEAMIVQNGHRLAMSLASRHFLPSTSLSETWNGVHQLKMIKSVTKNLDDKKLKTFAEDLSFLGKYIFSENNSEISLIGEEEDINAAINSAHPLTKLQRQNREEPIFKSPGIEFKQEIPYEGWVTTSAVSFVAQAFTTVRMKHDDAPALAVISKLLRSLYLHREIREKGGAYGGFALYNMENGIFYFASYRDPHIVQTLNVLDGAISFITQDHYSDEDIKEAVLQVCSEIDKPDPPGPSARKAFIRDIIMLEDEDRLKFKRRLLKLTKNQVRNTANKYFNPGKKDRAVAVISGETQLSSANKKLGENQLKINKI